MDRERIELSSFDYQSNALTVVLSVQMVPPGSFELPAKGTSHPHSTSELRWHNHKKSPMRFVSLKGLKIVYIRFERNYKLPLGYASKKRTIWHTGIIAAIYELCVLFLDIFILHFFFYFMIKIFHIYIIRQFRYFSSFRIK